MARASSVPGVTSVKRSGYSVSLLSAVSISTKNTAASPRVMVSVPRASSFAAAAGSDSRSSTGRPSCSGTTRFSLMALNPTTSLAVSRPSNGSIVISEPPVPVIST